MMHRVLMGLVVTEQDAMRNGIDAACNPDLQDLRSELSQVEKRISFCFRSMRSTTAASVATKQLREYRGKLEDAAKAYVRSRVGVDPDPQ